MQVEPNLEDAPVPFPFLRRRHRHLASGDPVLAPFQHPDASEHEILDRQ